MNFKLYLLLLLLPSMAAVSGQQVYSDQFAKANELYKSGDFDGAYAHYKVIGNKTASVWYNLGNTEYKRERYAQAIAHWCRAMREGGASFSDNCLYNINQAYCKMGIEYNPSWYEIAQHNTGYKSLFFFQVLFLFIFYSAYLMMILLSGGRRIIGISCLLLLFLFNSIGFVAAQSFWCSDTCIISSEKASLYVGPDSRFMAESEIKKASHAKIIDERNGWYKIKIGDQSGWISAEQVALV